jgi:hypothetical protein
MTILRRTFLVGTPLALAVILWFHPPGGDTVYLGIRDDVGHWLFVHTAFLFFIPLIAAVVYLLLDGVESRAATVSRISLVFFLVFYTAYEVTIGLVSGILIDYANGLPAAEQAAVADAIEYFNHDDLLGDPISVSLLLGFFGWVVALIAAAVAFKRSGFGWGVTVLVGIAAVFAIHPPPVGPVALICLALAAILIERSRAREATPIPA